MRPLKRVTKSTGNPGLELSQFRASFVHRKKKNSGYKEEEDASSRSYEIFNS